MVFLVICGKKLNVLGFGLLVWENKQCQLRLFWDIMIGVSTTVIDLLKEICGCIENKNNWQLQYKLVDAPAYLECDIENRDWI